ncbi:chitin-binding domain 3 protein [Mycolicibacterium canariasense]|uniref:Chitin-binding domain 3 protein n=1 Tax=Mycolicibacterium canariasense TaxID=228230 RepID=A0A100WJC2_MYCCR|nr:fibronectin type III domain-containing protein [Mycolicibacterium canariasense]MCV7213150.1 fibronectin type III domain-containing protein [Mycolicibacterium canariasense]ORU98495.1 hypothetical protein AWB94_28550 [Mycolicibacterium canariasense]GAS98888.1 chitin-binding domain 3 protein [Mycolicibacterium canariasense]
MAGDKLPGFDEGRARGTRFKNEQVPDEIDAVVAARVRSATSSTRRTMDERYGATVEDTGLGYGIITVGGGSEDNTDTPTRLELSRVVLAVGDGVHTEHTFEHNFGTRHFDFVLLKNSGDFEALDGCPHSRPNENTMILKPDEVWAPEEYLCVAWAIIPQGADSGSGSSRPTAPTLTATNITSGSISVTASASDPGGGIVAYNYFLDGALVGTDDATYTYVGLSPNTQYSLNATAINIDNRESDLSGTITPSTAATASVAPAGAVGVRTNASNNTTVTTTVLAGGNRMMLVWGFTTHTKYKDIASFNTITAVSDVDGSLGVPHAMISIRSASSQQQGAIVLWKKANATVGTHNILVTLDATGVTELATTAVVENYSGVASLDAAVTVRHDSPGTPISLAIPSAVGSYTAYASLSGNTSTSAQPTDYNQTLRYQNGSSSIGGLGKWIRVGDAPGGTSVVHSETTSLRNVAIGVNLVKAA